jgi:hypothetical protein
VVLTQKEKPQTRKREEQSSGGVISQDVGCGKEPSLLFTGHGDESGHGTALESRLRMVGLVRDITYRLRLSF